VIAVTAAAAVPRGPPPLLPPCTPAARARVATAAGGRAEIAAPPPHTPRSVRVGAHALRRAGPARHGTARTRHAARGPGLRLEIDLRGL
jgi:hypothetical protein